MWPTSAYQCCSLVSHNIEFSGFPRSFLFQSPFFFVVMGQKLEVSKPREQIYQHGITQLTMDVWGPVFWSFADEAAIVCWLGGSSCACTTGTASSTTTGRTTRATRRTSSWWDARDRCWGVAGHHRQSWEHLLGKVQMIMNYQMVFRSYWQYFNISNIGDGFCMELYHIISNIFPSWLRLSTSWTHFVHVFISA